MDEGDTYTVADLSLAEAGGSKVAWARSRMPALAALRAEAEKDQPLAGQRIAGCLHVTKETAVLIETIEAAGGKVSWSGCNPLSTQDDVAAWLASEGYDIHAWYGQNTEEFYQSIDRTLQIKPTLTLDDGADLIYRVHSKFPELAEGIIGGTEETTTGVHRLRAMGEAGELLYPVIAVNDASTKWDFDNVHGTGQSTIDGIIRATSVLLAGKSFVVAGYGHCGKGLANRARGMGANVIVTEVDPIAALKAVMDGYRVMQMDDAAKIGDVFCTATGMKDVIVGRHFDSMKEGAIVCNTGHYDCEINIPELEERSDNVYTIRDDNEAFQLKDGRTIHLLARGRLVNLAAAEGHPSEVMDMSFANQALGIEWLLENASNLKKIVYTLPHEIDHEIARMKLNAMDISIDTLTDIQERYLASWEGGT